jgi:hypothetical protein
MSAMTELKWIANPRHTGLFDLMLHDRLVAWLQPRPSYCDRGHWQVNCNLPNIDGADGFPRYYMERETAVRETELFVRWRLEQVRAEDAYANS